MAILTLPYGEGLERSKGIMVVRPTSFEDIRNMFLFNGKAQARGGLGNISVLQDDQPVDLDVTVLLAALRSEAAAVGIGYNTTGGTNREVWVNRLDIDGSNPLSVGLLGTLGVNATFTPPIIIGDDSDNRFFIAHDEPFINERFVTQFYDPFQNPPLVNLTANLDGEGDADVKFRGVVRHLSYIFGWGFGAANDPDRGDVVRVSRSGNSTLFDDDAFFEAGQRGEPVMVCRSAGNKLMVFKETETHGIFGYSPDTFGILPSDTLFGCVSSRLAVSVGNAVFFWSTQGPRMTQGGPSVDIAVPLDIEGPDPSTLVAESEVQDAFAEYDPATRVVTFVWGRRVYALSIRDPQRPRWSYYELGATAQCGGQFFSTQSTVGGGGAPTGAPENLTFPDPPNDTTSITVDFDNVGETGVGTQIEVQVSDDAGASYSVSLTVDSNNLATQQIVVELESQGPDVSIKPLTDYKIAMRYVRGGLHSVGYTSSDPEDWPVASTASTTTDAIPPQFVTRTGANEGLWTRNSPSVNRIINTIIIPAGHEFLDIEVEEEIEEDGNSTVQDLGDGTGAPDTADRIISAFAPLVTLAPGTTVLDRFDGTRNRQSTYRARFVNGANTSSFGLSQADSWAGPDRPQDGTLLVDFSGPNAISASWENAITPIRGGGDCPSGSPPSQHFTEAWFKNNTTGSIWQLMDIASPFGSGIEFFDPGATGGDELAVAIRHRVSPCGTPISYSKFSFVVTGTV